MQNDVCVCVLPFAARVANPRRCALMLQVMRKIALMLASARFTHKHKHAAQVPHAAPLSNGAPRLACVCDARTCNTDSIMVKNMPADTIVLQFAGAREARARASE
jgi:hypothetical protein